MIIMKRRVLFVIAVFMGTILIGCGKVSNANTSPQNSDPKQMAIEAYEYMDNAAVTYELMALSVSEVAYKSFSDDAVIISSSYYDKSKNLKADDVIKKMAEFYEIDDTDAYVLAVREYFDKYDSTPVDGVEGDDLLMARIHFNDYSTALIIYYENKGDVEWADSNLQKGYEIMVELADTEYFTALSKLYDSINNAKEFTYSLYNPETFNVNIAKEKYDLGSELSSNLILLSAEMKQKIEE